VLGGKILAGVLTLAATVAGAWITLVDRPEPYTIDHWKVAANATCERDFGNVQLPLYAATLQVGRRGLAARRPAEPHHDGGRPIDGSARLGLPCHER